MSDEEQTVREINIKKIEREIRKDLKDANLSAPKHVVSNLAFNLALSKELERDWAKGKSFDMDQYNRLTNAIMRGYQSLGLVKGRTDGAKVKNSQSTEPTDLEEYLNGTGKSNAIN